MKVHGDSAGAAYDAGTSNTINVIKSFYPGIDPQYFSREPNIFDRSFVMGATRGTAIFKYNGYIKKKALIYEYIAKIYAETIIRFRRISPCEACTKKGSWATVLAGKRPMGQFSVDSLFSPELHAVLEQPKIGNRIFRNYTNPSTFSVIVYRTDCEEGERYANRYIELYQTKQHLMDCSLDWGYDMKDMKSELVIAQEMGELFYYLPKEIEKYLIRISEIITHTEHARERRNRNSLR